MAFVRAIASAYTQRGLNPWPTLSVAQIAPEQFQQTASRITALQMEWLSATAMRELDDEALGWFRRRLPWGSYGMLVRASLTAPTLGVALSRWCRHHNLLTGDIRLNLSTSEQAWPTSNCTKPMTCKTCASFVPYRCSATRWV